MAENRSVDEILGILGKGDFDVLSGTNEDAFIEAKGSPYQLSTSGQKHELAKDVSALANAGGGIILIGFRAQKDISTSVEKIECSRPFELKLFDIKQYQPLLGDWIYPPIHCLQLVCYSCPNDNTKGVAAIHIPSEATLGKPYVVKRTVE